MLGGVDSDGIYRNDVWFSTDGANWQQATAEAGWSARINHTSLSFANKMWVLGGTEDYIIRENDVWFSTDGAHWQQVTAEADWVARVHHTSLVFDNKMWVLGGEVRNNIIYNDVWFSTDGANWQQATTNAAWSNRDSHTSLVFDNKMWVLGGNDGSRKNDVWFSSARNDNFESALALSLISSGNNDFSSDSTIVDLKPNQQDYYQFQLPEGNYRIETSSDIDTLCTLYNSRKTLVAESDNDGINNNCQITYKNNFRRTANLTLKVQGKTNSTAGFYQLLIKKAPSILTQ